MYFKTDMLLGQQKLGIFSENIGFLNLELEKKVISKNSSLNLITLITKENPFREMN